MEAAPVAGGYFGRALVVDLADASAETLALPDHVLRSYIGGAGPRGRLLHPLAPPGGAPPRPPAPRALFFSPPGGPPPADRPQVAPRGGSPPPRARHRPRCPSAPRRRPPPR